MFYANGDTYSGDWKQGHRDGLGKDVWANGETYDSEWKEKWTKKANSFAKSETLTMVNGKMTHNMEEESTLGQMEKHTMTIGRKNGAILKK